MRNLKKILSLALALMMVLSVMVTASATTFKDDAKISADYKEAVEVLTGMKVINGVGDEFLPQDYLNREAAAKIVAYILEGSELDAAIVDAINNPFSDVSGWSVDVIKYCYANGVVDGVGDGKFLPKDYLTGYAFAKMLLVAAGIDGEYTGGNWKLNIATNAKKAGLLKGLESVSLSGRLTREQACQMAWNALNYTPTGTTSEYVVFTDGNGNETPDEGEHVFYRGNDAITALLMQGSNQGSKLALVTTNAGSLGATVFGLYKTSSTDAFGRTSVVYTNGKSGTQKVTYASIAPTPVLTYSTPITKGKLAADLGCVKTTDTVSVDIITDGTAAGAANLNKTLTNATTDMVNGNGSVVEVYAATGGGYKAVVINTYVAKLDGTTNTITAAKAATATTDAQPAKVTIGGLDFETDAFKKNDVVLYTKGKVANADSIQSMEKATVVTGKIGKYVTNKTVTVNGTTYAFAANSANATTPIVPNDGTVFTTEYAFYVDGNNNVFMRGDAATAAPTADGIFYVDGIQIAYKAGGNSDLFAGASAAEVAVRAKVVTLTGQEQVIDVAVYTKTVNSVTKYYYVNQAGVETEITTSVALNPDINTWAAYTVENGKYTFQTLATAGAELLTLNAEYVKGTPTISAAAGSKYMTSSTVYTYINTADKKVDTVTGYKNIAIANQTKVVVVYADADKTTVKNAYVLSENADVTGSTANYAYAAAAGATVASGTEWTFYVGGEVKVLPVSLTNSDGYNQTSLTANKVYDLRISAEGVVTGAKLVGFAQETKKVSLITDGYIVADSIAYNLADKFAVYNVTTGNAGTADTLEVDDYVSFIYGTGANANKIVLIYIVDAPAAP